MSHATSGALLELREKLSASGFEAVAELYRVVSDDIEKHEAVIMDSLLGKDTKERKFYKNTSGA